MKNEERYILEWVSYHRIIGFDRIEVYENDSTDGTPALLKKLYDLRIIDFYSPWSNRKESPQISAYTSALKNCQTDWIMFLDADEFLNIRSRQKVNDFLENYNESISCIGINWRIFGSGGKKKYASDLVIERFTQASTLNDSANRHVKCIVRPTQTETAHIHAPIMRSGSSIMSNGQPLVMESRGINEIADFEIAQINHYFTKSYEEYTIKRKRGNANRSNDEPDKYTRYTDEMFVAHDLNKESDLTILWSANQLREQIENIHKILETS